MPLFKGFRDISLFRHISREFISRVVAQEVLFYKIAIDQTETDTYGESTNKFYNQGILLNCLLDRGDQTTTDTEYGPDSEQQVEFRFMRDDLQDINLFPEVGDIISYRNIYYEIHNVNENEYEMGRYPEYAFSEAAQGFGASWTISCETHYTRASKLNITKERF